MRPVLEPFRSKKLDPSLQRHHTTDFERIRQFYDNL